MFYIGKVCSGGENRKEEWSAIKEHFRKKGKEQTKLTPHHRVRIRKDAFMCRWNWLQPPIPVPMLPCHTERRKN
jgi:hypothetical protein